MSTRTASEADFEVDVGAVQSIAFDGFVNHPVASYLLLSFPEGKKGSPNRWLGRVRSSVAMGPEPKRDVEAIVAFTCAGLERFKLDRRSIAAFGPAFREGMGTSAHRAWDMGDTDDSAPEHWKWGNEHRRVEALLMLFGRDPDATKAAVAKAKSEAEAEGAEVEELPPAQWPEEPGVEGLREHFGFVDGVSQPEFRLSWDDATEGRLPPGELLLGYANGGGSVVEAPTVPASKAAREAGLRLMPDGARYDFGRGGSYLVFRQLEQNVKLFWSYMQGAAPELQSMERAAAKMIGRWRNGAPLTLVGEQPLDMTKLAPEAKADFGYVVNDDAAGMRCPIGAHIRRSNPRDALPGLRERNSLSKVDRRRILRRARPYGDPVPGWPDPQAMLDAKDDDEAARGLYFVCLNADIEEQFEFVQQRWLNDPTFVNGYADEVDPVIGRGRGGRFVVPGRVVAQLIDAPANNLKRFVTVRGGEYFFLPSGPALDYLARIAV